MALCLTCVFGGGAGSAGWFFGSDMYSIVSKNQQRTMQVAVQAPEKPLQSTTSLSASLSSENPSATPRAQITEKTAPAKEVTPKREKRETARKQEAKTSQSDMNSTTKKAQSSSDLSRLPQAAPAARESDSVNKALTSDRIYSISELPDDIRQGLPALSISTHIYSSEKSERLASIDGHVGREGQEILPGIILETITPDGAILSYHGYKIKVNLK